MANGSLQRMSGVKALVDIINARHAQSFIHKKNLASIPTGLGIGGVISCHYVNIPLFSID